MLTPMISNTINHQGTSIIGDSSMLKERNLRERSAHLVVVLLLLNLLVGAEGELSDVVQVMLLNYLVNTTLA